MFECRLKNAISSANCVPWDYPIPPSMRGNYEFCNSSTAQEGQDESTLSRFEAVMNSGDSITNCDCLADCEEVVYKTQVLYISLK